MRHEERTSPKAEEHHGKSNALLPAHDQAIFLLGMAKTSTGVTRPMMVTIVSGSAAASGITKQHQLYRCYNLYSAWRAICEQNQ